MNDVVRPIRRLLRPYQEFVLPVVLSLISAIAIIVGILPGISKTLDTWNQLSQERTEVAGFQQKEQFLESQDENTLYDQLSALTIAIPIDKSVPSILSTLDGVSAKTGAVFTSLLVTSPGSLATASATRQTAQEAALGAYITPFTVTMEGPFSALRDTIDSLTTSRRLFRIKSFTISFASEKLGRALVAMEAIYAPLKVVTGRQLAPLTSQEQAIISRVQALPVLSSGVSGGPPQITPRTDLFSP